jgi:hypothetical protein
MVTDHGYTWDQLREVPFADIHPRDTWVLAGLGRAWTAGHDGRLAGWTHGWHMPQPAGPAWTCIARDGDTITARSHEGVETTIRIPTGRDVQVLRVEGRVS